jgi:hypothetical protein
MRRQTLVRIVIGTPLAPPTRPDPDRTEMNAFALRIMEAIAALPGDAETPYRADPIVRGT